MIVTFFKSAFDNQVEVTEDYTWNELVAQFAHHRRTDTKNDLGFVLGKFKPAGVAREAKKPGSISGQTLPGSVGRYAENVELMYALCVDYDGGATISEVRDMLSPLRHIGYTSYNHLRDEGVEKFRIIIPLTTPCPGTEWKKRFRGFLPLFPGADATSFSLARIFYAPSTPASEDREVAVWSNDGETFDWTVIPAEEERQPVARPVGVKAGTGRVLRGSLNILELFESQGLDPRLDNAAEGKYKVVCPNYQQHTKHDKSGTVIWSGVPGRQDGFYCAHSHCQGTRVWDLFPTEVMEQFCEREDIVLELKKTKKVIEEGDQLPLDEVSPDQREFHPVHTDKARRANIDAFVSTMLRGGRAHGILRTPEGYGKSTRLVSEIMSAKKHVLFCCSSNKQANEKLESFKLWGAERAWGMSALIKHELEIEPVHGESSDPWGVPTIDKQATAELISKKLDCTIEEALEVIAEFSQKAKESQHSKAPVLVTTFATGARLFDTKFGKLDRIIIVDDPSTSDLIRFKYDFVEGELVEIARRDVEEVVFGQEYAFQDPVIWTTTEKLVTQLIKVQHQSAFITDIDYPVETGASILMYPTSMVRKRLKMVLPGIHRCVVEKTGVEHLLIANGVQAELNLVSSKGRNDLRESSVIFISYPHPLEVAALVSSLELDLEHQSDVVKQLVTDLLDQALGRGQGHRQGNFKSLVLCDPQLEITLRSRSRYRLNSLDGLKRRGRLKGVPLVWAVDHPSWWSEWVGYLAAWQKYVVVIGDKVFNTLTLEHLGLTESEAKVIKTLLQKPTEYANLVWKRLHTEIDGQEGRRNFTVDLCELVGQVNRSRNSEGGKVATSKRVGKRKFVSPGGESRLFVPGSEPEGWIQKKNKVTSGRKGKTGVLHTL